MEQPTNILQTAVSDTAVSFNMWRTLRLSSFQIGSATADILTASVWNRVMIAELGMPATWVGLLLALQYLLMPISFWAGHRSDTRPLWGRRRISYIWLGRGLVVLSFPLLGMSINLFEGGEMTTGWSVALVCFLLFGMGKLFSGSVYLALVRESAPPNKQGIAIGIAETVLIAFFPIMAIAYGRWMEDYDPRTFATMIGFTAVYCAFWWFFATIKSEHTLTVPTVASRSGGWGETVGKFKDVWADGRVRRFFLFLFVATFAAWMQDNILEPFGANVFGLPTGQTTRFTGYWGGATLFILILSFIMWRKRHPETLSSFAKVGLGIMVAGMLLLALTSVGEQRHLLEMSLLVFGGGFGLYTFGGVSLMAAMSPHKDAGAYLGLWTVCILVSKGLGTFTGGLLRDLFHLGFNWSFATSYGLIFAIAAVGLVMAAALLHGRQVISFVQDNK
ncbi:MAG: BCD family MFS transporter [Anaerolineae bacterium]|nr:BCD family MFS transporter [Anaerolineae bacterium]